MGDQVFDFNKDPVFSFDKAPEAVKDMFFGLSWNRHMDIDLAAVIVNANGDVIENVGFWNKHQWLLNGAIYHFGDDLAGSNKQTKYDNEQIQIRLNQMPTNVHYIYAVASVFNGRLQDANGCKMTIRSAANGAALASGTMSGKNTSLILARIKRAQGGADGGWTVEYINMDAEGRTARDLDTVIRKHARSELRHTPDLTPVEKPKGFFSRLLLRSS